MKVGSRTADLLASSSKPDPDAMQITRRFTREGHDPFAGIEFDLKAIDCSNVLNVFLLSAINGRNPAADVAD